MRRGPLFVFLLALAALPDGAAAQGAGARLFPVYLNVEGEYVRTTALLRLPYKAYAQAPASMAAGPLTPDERLFLQYVEAVRANDLGGFEAILAPPVPAAAKPQAESVSAAPRTAAQTLATYRDAFGGFADLRVEGSVPVDDGVLFIWTASTAKGRMVRGTTVRNAAERRQIAEVTMAQPVETFIVNSLNRLSPQELAGAASDAAAQRTTHALALTKTGVEFRFSGTRTNAAVPGEGALSPPVRALAERARACAAASVERLFAIHTPKSAAKLKQWFGTMNQAAIEAYMADLGRPREMRLLIDAGPVAIAFSGPQGASDAPSRDVRYDYLVRQGDTYKVGNVLYASFFDDVLKNTTAVAAFLEQDVARR